MTAPAAPGPPLVVVGLRREARLLHGAYPVRVGALGLDNALGEAGGLVSFGLCGALDPSLDIGAIVVARRVVAAAGHFCADRAWSDQIAARLVGAVRGDVTASGAIAPGVREKRDLWSNTGAVAVDMESHRVAEAAARAGLPFVVVRAVSDGAADTLPMAARAGFRPDGHVDGAAVLLALIRRPGELAALIRTARGAASAFTSLARAARVLDRPPP